MRSYRAEVRPMFSLAMPLVIAELGWMFMSVVDTMMVGRLPNGAEALAGTSLGGILYYTFTKYAGAVLFGMDTLVPQAFGAGNLRDCHRSLWTGAFLAVVLAGPAIAAALVLAQALPAFNVDARVQPVASSYMRILTLGTPPLFLFFAMRHYLQALGVVGPVMFALVSANLVNVLANWLLIYGNLGFPAMGTDGSAWATVLSRLYMAAVLLAALLRHNRLNGWRVFAERRLEWERLNRIVRLGFPAATHIVLEIAVFAVATTFIAQLNPVASAANQIALTVASVTFMVPVGISAAAAVRVGHAMGRSDPAGAGWSGWIAIAMGASFMAFAAVILTVFPRQIALRYTGDAAVVAASVALLRIAAVFQLFDAFQVVAAGALRGLGDTRTPMLVNLFLYWGVGLPAGYTLCFTAGWGAEGMWIGLCAALVLIGSTLVTVWRRRIRELIREANPLPAGEKSVA